MTEQNLRKLLEQLEYSVSLLESRDVAAHLQSCARGLRKMKHRLLYLVYINSYLKMLKLVDFVNKYFDIVDTDEANKKRFSVLHIFLVFFCLVQVAGITYLFIQVSLKKSSRLRETKLSLTYLGSFLSILPTRVCNAF